MPQPIRISKYIPAHHAYVGMLILQEVSRKTKVTRNLSCGVLRGRKFIVVYEQNPRLLLLKPPKYPFYPCIKI